VIRSCLTNRNVILGGLDVETTVGEDFFCFFTEKPLGRVGILRVTSKVYVGSG
jgi:hypothetical protein